MAGHEVQRGTHVLERGRRKDFVIRLSGPRRAVTQAGQVHAQHDIPSAGPASRERHVHAPRADVISGPGVEQNHCAATRFVRCRLGDDAEQAALRAEQDGALTRRHIGRVPVARKR